MVDPFRQAEAQYHQLSGDLAAGRIGGEQFRALLNQLRVTDGLGRTWMLQEGSGQWFVWHNGQWQAASPYPATPVGAPAPSMPPSNLAYAAGNYGASSGAPAAGSPAAGSAAYAQAQPGYPQALPPLNGSWGKVFVKTLGAAVAALVIFALIGLALVAFADDFELGAQMPTVMIVAHRALGGDQLFQHEQPVARAHRRIYQQARAPRLGRR